MILDATNYEKETFNSFVKEHLMEHNQSCLYGKYEYWEGKYCYFGHFYKNETVTVVTTSDSYSGFADSDGYVSLTKNTFSNDYDVIVHRRDLSSLEDEILRYAEYCRLWVTCLDGYLDYQIKNSKNTGKIDDPRIPEFYKDVHRLICKKLDTDPKFAILAKVHVEKFYKALNIHHPWLHKKYVWYMFVSSIMSPEEVALDNEYTKKKLEKNNDYWLKREKLHFSYLESKLDEVNLEFDPKPVYEHFNPNKKTIKKDPFKGILFPLSIVFSILCVFAYIGLPAALKEMTPPPTSLTYLWAYLGTTLVFLPAFIILVVKIVRHHKYIKQN